MVEPAELLQDLGMIGVPVQDALVRRLCAVILQKGVLPCARDDSLALGTYVFLLLMHVADLEPDVLLGQGRRWRLHDVFETLREG